MSDKSLDALRRGALLLIFLLLFPWTGPQAREGEPRVGYEFATWLGTGLYRIDGRDLWILNLPLRRELREASGEHLGLRLLLPVSIGWLDSRRFATDDVQTLTFIPGLELVYRPYPSWTLRPFAQTGIGKDFSRGENAWIYAAGVKSRLSLTRGNYTFALGNGLVAAGSRSKGDSSSFVRLDLGFDVERPLQWRLAGRGTKLSVFYFTSLFSDNADFASSFDTRRSDLGTVHNVGVALGVQQPFRVLGFKLKWLGISWVTGDNIEGVRINTGFPF